MASDKRIRTVLYNDQRFTAAELELLHTPALQRLYDLHQLGFADRVFVDASHSRLHHVVGVLAQVDKLMNAIVRNLRDSHTEFVVGQPGRQSRFTAVELAERAERALPVCRLIGLLHDLTHAPFGHTVEDEIHIVASRHDDPARQAEAFYRLLCQLAVWLARDAGWAELSEGDEETAIPADIGEYADGLSTLQPSATHVGKFAANVITRTEASIRAAAWRIDSESLNELFVDLHVAMTALLHLEALHATELTSTIIPAQMYPFQEALEECLKAMNQEQKLSERRFVPHRDAYMLDVVGNTVCADLLDYAKRDSHFTGLRLDYDADRIAENFTLVPFDVERYGREMAELGEPQRTVPLGIRDPFAGRCVRTAISLFSHKFRSDVPGELMNLLNARFHLYERAIYHPTKCVAGAMLGTALQLVGWRRSAENPDPLPSTLRDVGDAVFLHQVIDGAQSLLSDVLAASDSILETKGIGGSPVARSLAATHAGCSRDEVLDELAAGISLLRRLTSRRFYRQIYRALPNSKHSELQVGPDTLAAALKDAGRRYEAERQVERRAGLRLGSVVIHCPKRTTATKVANVLLVMPEDDKRHIDRVFKLCHISQFGPDLFAKHGEAVASVTAMYKSMWRLGVYVSPEYAGEFKRISRVIGAVIAEGVARYLNVDQQPAPWPNDPQLEIELNRKLGHQSTPGAENSDSMAEVSFASLGSLRAHKILESSRPFLRRTPAQPDLLKFVSTFGPPLAGLTDPDFEAVDALIHKQAQKTEFANAKTIYARGSKLDRVAARLREALQQHGVDASKP